MSRYLYGAHRDEHPEQDRLLRLAGPELPVPDTYLDVANRAPVLVFDQNVPDAEGSCTANALCVDMAYRQQREEGGGFKTFSRNFQYNNELELDGNAGLDVGSTGRSMVTAAETRGICLESTVPYCKETFGVRPPDEAYAEALLNQGITHERVPMDEGAIMQAILADRPPCVGIGVYESFESDEVTRTGLVPLPRARERSLGGHEVWLMGWKRADTGALLWLLRNSWGAAWGDHGNFWLPEAYLLDADLTYDLWALSDVETEDRQK